MSCGVLKKLLQQKSGRDTGLLAPPLNSPRLPLIDHLLSSNAMRQLLCNVVNRSITTAGAGLKNPCRLGKQNKELQATDSFCLSFQDKVLTKDEILEKYNVFVGSKATNYGKDLTRHDEF